MVVTVAPSDKAFIGLTETKEFLDPNTSGGSLADGSQDDRLQRLINGVCQALEGSEAVNSPILNTEAVEYYSGGEEKILLRRGPVASDPAPVVVENGTTLTPAADGSTATAGGGTPDYWLDPAVGVLERNGTWVKGRRVVKVTYTAGRGTRTYDQAHPEQLTSNIPDDLRLAAMMWVAASYAAGGLSYSTQITSDNTVVRPSAMPIQVRALVGQYRWVR